MMMMLPLGAIGDVVGGIGRPTADEHAPEAPLQEARFDEVLQQYSAHLPVEARQMRGVGGGELRAGLYEQNPDTRERFLDTSCLE
jgi:hypothetical protein